MGGREGERERDRQTHRQTDRETDRQTDRQTDRDTQRELRSRQVVFLPTAVATENQCPAYSLYLLTSPGYDEVDDDTNQCNKC